MDWFCYNLIILIKQCKIPYKKFRQSSIVFKKPGILSDFEELQLSYSSIFFAETSHKFSTYQCLQRVCSIYLFIYLLSYLQKIKKTIFSTHLVFTPFLKNSKSKQNKKIPHIISQTLLRRKRVQNFSKKY